MSIALIILAAGKGTRMNSDLPKVLHPIATAPLLIHAMKSAASLEPEKTVIVVGHGGDAVGPVASDFDETAVIVTQQEQLGTGHAVGIAADALNGFAGDALILYGDTPFIRPETLERMAAARDKFEIVILGFTAADPGRYGRLVMAGDTLEKIVEFADAKDEERTITLCNSGVIMANIDTLQSLVSQIDNNNASGEYYLTDIVEIARKRGLSATSVTCDESETLGINSRAELAAAEAAFQSRARQNALQDGVAMQAPDTVYFAHDTVIGRDAIIEPNVYFGPNVTVESGAHIRAFSHLEGCHVSRGAIVGPFARLRPGAELSENVRIGNFVEIKNAQIDSGAKVNHLSYVGDAEIGKAANLGAGTVTCNYDGVMKHKTVIGEGAFIGSSTMLVAPVRIGAQAMTASGSVITKDVPDAALALARPPQVNKLGLAKKLFAILRLKKKKRNSEGVI